MKYKSAVHKFYYYTQKYVFEKFPIPDQSQGRLDFLKKLSEIGVTLRSYITAYEKDDLIRYIHTYLYILILSLSYAYICTCSVWLLTIKQYSYYVCHFVIVLNHQLKGNDWIL